MYVHTDAYVHIFIINSVKAHQYKFSSHTLNYSAYFEGLIIPPLLKATGYYSINSKTLYLQSARINCRSDDDDDDDYVL